MAERHAGPVRVGLIVGSVREGRRAPDVASWVLDGSRARDDLDVRVLDLLDFDLPVMTAAVQPMRAARTYDDDRVTSWSRAVDDCEAFILLTPEYNHGVPGALKNAVDHLGPEWVGKAVAFVSWGSEGGVRAVEQWRAILSNFQMTDVRQQVALSTFYDYEHGQLNAGDRRQAQLDGLLDQLVEAAVRLRRN